MARNLFFSPLFVSGALCIFRGAALGHLPLVLPLFLGTQCIGGRFISALLVLRASAFKII